MTCRRPRHREDPVSAYKTLKALAGSAGFGTTKLLVPEQTMDGARRCVGQWRGPTALTRRRLLLPHKQP